MNIYEINGSGYTAKINLSQGANCIYFKKGNADILRTPDYCKPLDNPFLYGMPILFPANRISGGYFEFEGREYRFPINEENTNCHLHGIIHKTEFLLESICENSVSAYCNVMKRNYFPHDYRIKITYSLSENGLLHTTEITNLSDTNMPLILGYHTTFNIPFIPNSTVQNVRIFATIGDEIERNNSFLPTGRICKSDTITEALKSGEFCPNQKLSRHYKTNGGIIEIDDIEYGQKVIYENGTNYKFRLFYGTGKDFICLEPMSGMADCANSPFGREYSGFGFIEPHQTEVFTSKIYLCEY
ncbi:MAG: aldose 1-epimerase [Alphaproteobacteria bacterium]|nr:aldose 1-epimerase [Alphaproteobacteria bacterium]